MNLIKGDSKGEIEICGSDSEQGDQSTYALQWSSTGLQEWKKLKINECLLKNSLVQSPVFSGIMPQDSFLKYFWESWISQTMALQ